MVGKYKTIESGIESRAVKHELKILTESMRNRTRIEFLKKHKIAIGVIRVTSQDAQRLAKQ